MNSHRSFFVHIWCIIILVSGFGYHSAVAGLASSSQRASKIPKLILPSIQNSKPARRSAPTGTATVYTVTNTADSGAGSFRQALIDATIDEGPDFINFNIPGAGVHTITPLSDYPVILDAVIIDGTTQPGYAGTPLIEIDGINVIGGIGLNIQASDVQVMGLAITRFQQFLSSGGNGVGIGIFGEGTTNVWIHGNHIGVDASGEFDRGNAQIGIWIGSGTFGNIIGTNGDGEIDYTEGNVISGNDVGSGILVQGNANVIAGNFIGTNRTGTLAIQNEFNGVQIQGGSSNTVGGTLPDTRNILSGNVWDGVQISNGGAENTVVGNYIGTDVTGTFSIPNESNGVEIWGTGSGNIVENNVISGNDEVQTDWGILILDSPDSKVRGNFIGTTADGLSILGNGVGVVILGTSSGNVIGGPGSARNIISGSEGWYNSDQPANGVVLAGGTVTGNVVRGNYIGTDLNGNSPIPNSSHAVGIFEGAYENTIGGDAGLGEGNVISGNDGNGIAIRDAETYGNIIAGNYIGVDAAGADNLSNNLDGVKISNGANANVIGGASAGSRNVISGNGANGIQLSFAGSANLISGNYIGLLPDGVGALPNGISGIHIDHTPDTDVDGTSSPNYISGNSDAGIFIDGPTSSGNVVRGSVVGLNTAGDARPNSGGGIRIFEGPANYIGMPEPGAGNVVSGNTGPGILVTGTPTSGNQIVRNLIGLDPSGALARPNTTNGILFMNATSSTVAANTISGNGTNGIQIFGSYTDELTIVGNHIGTQIDGSSPLGNSAHGILFSVLIEDYSSNNIIGGSASGEGNVIAYNGGAGISMSQGYSNLIRGNSIYQNGLLGIDLSGDGVTANDAGDGDFGANSRQNYPDLVLAASDLQGVQGILHSQPNQSYTIEFFKSSLPDSSGFGEGETPIGALGVVTDASGDAPFFASLPGMINYGDYITATATDATNNTSEFSAGISASQKIKSFGDHYVVNTTLSGIPLHWDDGKGTYRLSNSIPAPNRPAVQSGFAAWDALPQLTMTNGGLTPSMVWGGNPDGLNNVSWLTSDWEATTGADANTIAVTRVRYNALNGIMTDVDIAFDAQHFNWSTVDDTTSSSMNVRNVTTHEAGHFNGLGDIYEPSDPGYVPLMGAGNREVSMYGYIRGGEFKKNSLDSPDTAGIGYIYSHVPSSRVDLILVFDGSSTFASTYQALNPSKNSSIELIQKMRVGDRIGIVRMPNITAFNLTEITGQATKSAAKNAVQSIIAGGRCAVGSALTTAQSGLNSAGAAGHAKAMILFSSSEEDTTPSAYSALSAVASAGTQVFTLGFPNSSGQPLADSIATRTGGAYFTATAPTIGNIVDQIWNRLIGQQLLTDTTVLSNNVPGYPQPGLKWQGAVDPGTTSIQPGLKWQGSDFILTLITPSSVVIDSATAAANPSDGIEYFSGPTFAYYNVLNPEPGIWTLSVQGREYPPTPEPLNLYILSYTDLTMSVLFNKGSYAPGEQIVATTEVFRGGIVGSDLHVVGGTGETDAVVNALVTIPGTGSTQVLPMPHVGGGVYRGTFTNTAHSGSYDFRVTASKPDDFQRQMFQAVYVEPPFSCPSNIVVNTDPYVCSAVVNYSIVPLPGVTVVSTPPSGSSFPKGSTTVTSVSTDPSGAKDTCKFIVTVNDKQRPKIRNEYASPDFLRPADKKMKLVTIYYTATDNCGPVTTSLSVESNEHRGHDGCSDDDDNRRSPDWIIIDAHRLYLRAEKNERGYARVYTITITAVDGSGNVSTEQVRVTVSKDGNRPGGHGLEEVAQLPETYALHQNMPNPFNPTTTIRYALPEESNVSIKIFNTLGQLVATLVDNVEDAGFRTATFDANNIAAGVYFCRLEAVSTKDPERSFSEVRKMLLVK